MQPLKNDPEDPFATCLVAARDLVADEEILIDYGAGSPPAGRAEAFLVGLRVCPAWAGAFALRGARGRLPAGRRAVFGREGGHARRVTRRT